MNKYGNGALKKLKDRMNGPAYTIPEADYTVGETDMPSAGEAFASSFTASGGSISSDGKRKAELDKLQKDNPEMSRGDARKKRRADKKNGSNEIKKVDPSMFKVTNPLFTQPPSFELSPKKDGVKFAAKQGAKEAIKKVAGNIAAKVFGAAGMILTPTTVYAGGEKKGGTITNEELKEQSKLIPEETQEQFQARMAKQNK